MLIVVDTLRADHLSCYGNPRVTSPNLDRLAADGSRFERCSSHAPWTTPSIGALMTSKYPSYLGILEERSTLADDLVLLAEVFQEQGYQTCGVVSHTFCSAKWGFAQGFDTFNEDNVLGGKAICSPGVSDRGLQFLREERDPGRPFLLFLHYFDPHFNYFEHAEYPFSDGPAYEGPIDSGMEFGELLRMQRRMSDADVAEVNRLYDSEIAFTDEHIGRVLDKLRAMGLYDETLIVFTADHGEEFLEHGQIGHTKTLYNEVLHVPLLVKFPRDFDEAPPVGPIADPIAHVDLYPTLVDVAGLHGSDLLRDVQFEGTSLLRRDADGELPAIFAETSRKRTLRSVTTGNGRFKLILDLDSDTVQLFDLENDPGETLDVASQHRDVTKALRRQLRRWLRRVKPAVDSSTELSDEEKAALRGTGYLDADRVEDGDE